MLSLTSGMRYKYCECNMSFRYKWDALVNYIRYVLHEDAILCQGSDTYGEVEFDVNKPDGTMRKLIDVSKLHRLGWKHKIEIEEGVPKLFEWFRKSLTL